MRLEERSVGEIASLGLELAYSNLVLLSGKVPTCFPPPPRKMREKELKKGSRNQHRFPYGLRLFGRGAEKPKSPVRRV